MVPPSPPPQSKILILYYRNYSISRYNQQKRILKTTTFSENMLARRICFDISKNSTNHWQMIWGGGGGQNHIHWTIYELETAAKNPK